MNESELRRIAATYFGFTPTINEKKVKIRVYRGEDLDIDVSKAKGIKVKWEEHMGNLTGVARITPLDLMHDLSMGNTEENYRKAVEIMKALAKRDSLYLIEIPNEEKFLLINPKYRR